MNATPEKPRGWRFSRAEKIGLSLGLVAVLAFGINLEQRTALRRTPMTDLGVFACAAWAVRSGDNPYAISDWHGWHYQYPLTLAILFTPLAHPVPTPPPALAPGERRTEANTPWGYPIDGHRHYVGLNTENTRFFWIVAIWYLISVLLFPLSAHLLACTLEKQSWLAPPPDEKTKRRRWWAMRWLPLLVCAGSVGTELSRGQMDVLMLAVIALGLYLAAQGRDLTAGLCIAFPATIKLFPPLLLLYPIWRRRWRMTAGMVTGLVVCLAILPAAMLGPKRTVELYRVWIEVLAKPALGHGTDTSRARELTSMNATDNQSLLSAIHNWRYYHLSRKQLPAEAAPWERQTAYAVGALMLAGVGLAARTRRQDSPREMLIIAGLLIGLAFVISPTVHNFYHLLMLPLVAALIERALRRGSGWKPFVPIIIFMLVDILFPLPILTHELRHWGVPLLSLIYLLCAGALALGGAKREPGV